MTSLTITQARKQLYSLLGFISDSHEPVHITGKHHSAVLIAEEDWAAIEETLYLTSIPGMKKSIIQGLKTPIKKCSKELPW
jgi:antitoxin YefM